MVNKKKKSRLLLPRSSLCSKGMGSSNSRLGSTRSTSWSRFRRSSLSSLLCGSSLPLERVEHLDEPLSQSSQSLAANCSNSRQQSSLISGSEAELASSTAQIGAFAGSSSNASTNFSSNSGSGNGLETHVTDTSSKFQPCLESLPADAPPGTTHENQEDVNPLSFRDTVEDTSSGGSSARSDFHLTSEALPGFILTVGEQGLIGMGVLLVDVASVNPNTLPSRIAEVSNREARRHSRRMYLDALSSISSSRGSDSPTALTTRNADDIRSHDRLHLDYSGDLSYDSISHESWYSNNRRDRWGGRRWRSRNEMSESFHHLHDEVEWESSCSTGLHTRGSCSCNSSTAEEPRSLTGISPFVMVADALFEVIEEIRRHRMSLSLSMLTLPAPEAVVDSFPLKNHKKLHGTESGTSDTLLCHICLVDYEEGDRIRVLPCSHEYHMSCVDKWLKEIHGVCPLCRDDVSKGRVEDSTSNLEIPFL